MRRLEEHDGAVPDVLPQDVVMDVDDPEVGSDPEHHAVTNADELVLEPIIGYEGDYLAPSSHPDAAGLLALLAALPARLLQHLAMLLLAHLLSAFLDE
jgi:hypothetical protein